MEVRPSAVAYCYVNAPHSGKVGNLVQLEAMQKRPDVIWAKPLVKLGADVVGPRDGLPTRLCDLFVTKPKPIDALDFLFALKKENPVPVLSRASASPSSAWPPSG